MSDRTWLRVTHGDIEDIREHLGDPDEHERLGAVWFEVMPYAINDLRKPYAGSHGGYTGSYEPSRFFSALGRYAEHASNEEGDVVVVLTGHPKWDAEALAKARRYLADEAVAMDAMTSLEVPQCDDSR